MKNEIVTHISKMSSSLNTFNHLFNITAGIALIIIGIFLFFKIKSFKRFSGISLIVIGTAAILIHSLGLANIIN